MMSEGMTGGGKALLLISFSPMMPLMQANDFSTPFFTVMITVIMI